jgi:hypothetical protein
MRKSFYSLLLAVGAAGFLAVPLLAASRWYFTTATFTDVSSTKTFSDAAGAFNARSVCVFNDDADQTDSIYVSLKGAAATTSDPEIKYADRWRCYTFDPVAGGDGWTRVDVICASGKTAAGRVEAMR